MFFSRQMNSSTEVSWDQIQRLKQAIEQADAILIGAGAGLSTSAGFLYSGQRFWQNFSDFSAQYGFQDMYSGSFYPYETLEEQWAFWSRNILVNRYQDPPKPVYQTLRQLVQGKDYFVLTTNVDHCFQKAGFDKDRLFYTQGDYGLWQCSQPCHQQTYDNEEAVRRMVEEQRDLRIPTELIPRCPRCGKPMSMNLRADDTFVQDQGWYRAADRYGQFLQQHQDCNLLLLELGVGMNTPGIIKYPFWRMTEENKKALYACVNQNQAFAPAQLADQALLFGCDIGWLLDQLI